MPTDQAGPAAHSGQPVQLKRALGLGLLTLYGLGVTIGAGIYVLIGAVAAKAGMFMPASFAVAALVVAFTAFSYAELGSRFPVSAGEAEYAMRGFHARWLATIVGLLVAATGIISAATISIGAASYLETYAALPRWFLIVCIVIVLGAIAIRGILESVALAAVFTLIEMAGLALAIIVGLNSAPQGVAALAPQMPPLDSAIWAGIFGGSLLAFFAFVGFEDIANVAEEVKEPERTIPRAIMLTLAVTLVLYIAIAAVAVRSIPMDALKTSSAPLALIFAKRPASLQLSFTAIAAFATLNGVLIQMIMASRLLFGLARQGNLPKELAHIYGPTQTPAIATLMVMALILSLALFFPIADLAKLTSQFVLVVFIVMNASLLRIRLGEAAPPPGIFRVPLFVPVLGLLASAALLVSGFVLG